MTTTPDLARLSLRSPDALLAALPFLLGFRPERSAVLAWLSEGRLLLTQRLDLPDPTTRLADWLDAACGHAAATCADEVVIVVVSPDAAEEAVAHELRHRVTAHGIVVRDALRLDEGRWWSLLCIDPDCCPLQGRPIDPQVCAEVAAEFAFLGRAPLRARDELVQEMAPDPGLTQRVAEVIAGRPPRPRRRSALERWRDRSVDAVMGVGGESSDIEAEAVADVLLALADIRVRDTVLWEAARWGLDRMAVMTTALAVALRAAPPGHVAPVATCLAALWWLSGDGARAQIALDRCAQDDPDYSLAALLSAAIGAGLPPEAWRRSMAVLTREDCRHGVRPEASEGGSDGSG